MLQRKIKNVGGLRTHHNTGEHMKESLSIQSIVIDSEKPIVNQLIGTITHRSGQISKNTMCFAIQVRNCLWREQQGVETNQ